MSVRIISSLPTTTALPDESKRQVAFKHLAHIALSAIEESQHQEWIVGDRDYESFYQEKSGQIHWLNQETPIYDATGEKFVTIDRSAVPNKVLLRGIPIIAATREGFLSFEFSRAAGTEHAVFSMPSNDFILLKETEIPKAPDTPPKETLWHIQNKSVCFSESGSSKNIIVLLAQERSDSFVHPARLKAIEMLPVENLSDLKQTRLMNKVLGETANPEELQAHAKLLDENEEYTAIFEDKKVRIHSFESSSIRIFDYTENQIASTAETVSAPHVFIFLKIKRVLFPFFFNPGNIQIFSSSARKHLEMPDHVIIRDVPGCNWVSFETKSYTKDDSLSAKKQFVDLSESGDFYTLKLRGPQIIIDRPTTLKLITEDGSSKKRAL
jgi:hypothetical protein